MAARAFVKMQGLGNDFVVFDATRQPLPLTVAQARHIADRRLGIGCDQILIIEAPAAADADFGYRIINADGSASGQCGNGARCVAQLVRRLGLTTKKEVVFDTDTGRITVTACTDGRYAAVMGVPVFEPAQIPFSADARADFYPLCLDDGRRVSVQALAIGNPHAVVTVDVVADAPVAELGPVIECHPRFPERVNVGFMAILEFGRIDLRVYERGAGETRACGSGACAAVIAGRQAGVLAACVQVALPGGILDVAWPGEGAPVTLTGPATTVYDGSIDLQGN